jgi:hypothetical protein
VAAKCREKRDAFLRRRGENPTHAGFRKRLAKHMNHIASLPAPQGDSFVPELYDSDLLDVDRTRSIDYRFKLEW